MEFFRGIWPSIKEEDPPESMFSAEKEAEIRKNFRVREGYYLKIAKRFQEESGIDPTEAAKKAETEGIGAVLPPVIHTDTLDIVEDSRKAKEPPDLALQKINSEREKDIISSMLGPTRDYFESLRKKSVPGTPLTFDEIQSTKAVMLNDALDQVRNNGAKGFFGTGADLLGLLGREFTYGMMESAFGWKTDYTEEWLGRYRNASIQEAPALLKEFIEYSDSIGMFGNNSIYKESMFRAAETGGKSMAQQETLDTILNIATAIPVTKIAKAVSGGSKAVSGGAKATTLGKAVVNAGSEIERRAITQGMESADSLVGSSLDDLAGGKPVVDNFSEAAQPSAMRVGNPSVVEEVPVTSKFLEYIRKNSIATRAQTTDPEVLQSAVENATKRAGPRHAIVNVVRKEIYEDVPVQRTPEVPSAPAPTAPQTRTPSIVDRVISSGKPVSKDIVKDLDEPLYIKTIQHLNNKDVTRLSKTAFDKLFPDTDLKKYSAIRSQLVRDGIIKHAKGPYIGQYIKVPQAFEETTSSVPTQGIASAPTTTQQRTLSEILERDISPVIKENLNSYGSMSYEVHLGKADGTLYDTAESAQKAAQRIGGTAVNVLDKWAIKFERNFTPVSRMGSDEIFSESERTMKDSLFSKLLSKNALTRLDLESILKVDYIKSDLFRKVAKKQLNSIFKGLTKEEKSAMLGLIDDFEADLSRTSWPSVEEFAAQYMFRTGKNPQNVMEKYLDFVDLKDTAYILKAESDLILKQEIGFFKGTFRNDSTYVLRKVRSKDLKDLEGQVYDIDTGTILSNADLKKKGVFEIDGAGIVVGDGKYAKYVTGEFKYNRPLKHADVRKNSLSGGRVLSNASHVVTQRNFIDGVGNVTRELNPLTPIVTRSLKEAQDIASQINNILTGLRPHLLPGKGTGKLPADIDNLIRSNNSFNPQIESATQFLKWAEESGISISDNVSVKGMSDKVIEGESLGKSYRQVYDENVYNPSIPTRAISYGSGDTEMFTLDTMGILGKDLATGLNWVQTKAYLEQATTQFLAATKSFLKNGEKDFKALSKKTPSEQVRLAQFDLTTEGGRAAFKEQQTLLSRLRFERDVDISRWDSFATRLNSIIFDISGKEPVRFWDFTSLKPDRALRSFAFQTRMGFLAPDQFIVQAWNVIQMATIHPIEGPRAVMAYPALRLLSLNHSPELLNTVAKRGSKLLGMSEDEFKTFVEFYRRSGIGVVGDSVQELGHTSSIGTGIFSSLKDGSTFFFREGEKVSQTSAYYIGFKEFRKRFPSIDVTTPQGISQLEKFVINYSQELTMNMRAVSNAGWQSGYMGIVTQWMSANQRFWENVFFSRTLTGKQRTMLALSQGALYGATGYGLGNAAVYMLNSYGGPIDDDTYFYLKNGAIDTLLSEATGTKTDIASRMSFAQGIVDTVLGVVSGEKTPFEVLSGPSTGLALTTASDGISFISSIIKGVETGDFDEVSYKSEDFLRNIKTLDKISQFYYWYNTGELRSRKGYTLIEDASSSEAFLSFLAIQLEKTNTKFDLLNFKKYESKLTDDLIEQARKYVVRIRDTKSKEEQNKLQRYIINLGSGIRNPRELKRFYTRVFMETNTPITGLPQSLEELNQQINEDGTEQ